jgi:NAD-dependent SIR2 family protein deacetylase
VSLDRLSHDVRERIASRAPGTMIGVQCQHCSHWYPEAEIIRFGESMTRCLKCQEAINKALEMNATQTPPSECAHCHRGFSAIADATPGDVVEMALVMVDGVFVALCDPCERAYVEKRKDLYGDTRFGWNRKLK